MLVIYVTAVVTATWLVRYILCRYHAALPCAHDHRHRHRVHGTAAQTAPRYPHLDPLLGLDLAVHIWRDFQKGRLAEGMRQRHLRHGRTFSANHWGAETIYTIEPENIRAMTTHDFDRFGKAAWVAEAAKHVGHGILLNEGQAWKHSRAMLKPIFNRTTSGLDEPTMLEPHVQRLVHAMRTLSRENKQDGEAVGQHATNGFDFHELASMFTLDIVTEFLFGKSTLCLRHPRQDGGHDGVHFLSLVKDFEGPSAKFIAVGPLAWLGLAPSYRRLIRLVDGMKAFFRNKLNDIISEETMATTTTTPCCGSAAPQSQSPSHSPSVFRSMKAAGASDDQIQGEVQNIFFASYDTTSAFLANVMHVLVQHPGIQLRLRREIGILSGRSPTNKDLTNFEYLRCFLMESQSCAFFPPPPPLPSKTFLFLLRSMLWIPSWAGFWPWTRLVRIGAARSPLFGPLRSSRFSADMENVHFQTLLSEKAVLTVGHLG